MSWVPWSFPLAQSTPTPHATRQATPEVVRGKRLELDMASLGSETLRWHRWPRLGRDRRVWIPAGARWVGGRLCLWCVFLLVGGGYVGVWLVLCFSFCFSLFSFQRCVVGGRLCPFLIVFGFGGWGVFVFVLIYLFIYLGGAELFMGCF